MGAFDQGKTLYCVVYLRTAVTRGVVVWIPGGFEYLMAEDAGEARILFLTAHRGDRVKVEWIGPVIGYHVEDTKGDVLSV